VFIALSLACSAPLGGRDRGPGEPAAAPLQDRLPLIEHLAPKRDSTGGVPPKFEWTAIEGADQYVIQMWNDIDVLLWRQYLPGTSVAWPKELKVEEGTYFWAVGALRGETVVGESGRAAFVILDKR
jgi:hypothetical protein